MTPKRLAAQVQALWGGRPPRAATERRDRCDLARLQEHHALRSACYGATGAAPLRVRGLEVTPGRCEHCGAFAHRCELDDDRGIRRCGVTRLPVFSDANRRLTERLEADRMEAEATAWLERHPQTD